MSERENRRVRRESRRATLRMTASAPSFKAVKAKPSRRLPIRRALFAATTVAIFFAMMIATPKAAHAGFTTPEIDPSSMAGAMTLLVGGVLALTDRNRRS